MMRPGQLATSPWLPERQFLNTPMLVANQRNHGIGPPWLEQCPRSDADG